MENMRKKDLGFECMRMPLIDPKDTASFDFNRIKQLFDVFLEKGFNILMWHIPTMDTMRRRQSEER